MIGVPPADREFLNTNLLKMPYSASGTIFYSQDRTTVKGGPHECDSYTATNGKMTSDQLERMWKEAAVAYPSNCWETLTWAPAGCGAGKPGIFPPPGR
jgi:hypothetical protein